MIVCYLFLQKDQLIPGIFFSLVYIGCIVELVWYLNRTNRKIAFFLDAVRNEDTTLVFQDSHKSKAVRELIASLNGVNHIIGEIRFELQEQEQYFKSILEIVSVGIVTLDEKGNFHLVNSTAKQLLNYEHFTTIEQLARIDKDLFAAFRDLQPGDHLVVPVQREGVTVQLSLRSVLFKKSDNTLQLVAIQDIKSELEENELESWIKLIRVLTHEIMNTVAPITSLSESLLRYYTRLDGAPPSEKVVSSTFKGLKAINERGRGLMDFVESYRKLTRLPQPEKELIKVKSLLEDISVLTKTGMKEDTRIYMQIIPEDLNIMADKKLVSQVIINLIRNAIEALQEVKNGEIRLTGETNLQGRPQIRVTDNGPGIEKDLIDKIFIPFFTTRSTGSGIGLSLSRQIMQLHKGQLTISSEPGKCTSAVMVFQSIK
jgi:nitrogen fixation/metabolism regulation signal transduction histidine kinase